MTGAFASRAASSEATTVEEEVTFYSRQRGQAEEGAFAFADDGRDGETLLLRILEQVEHIVSNNDTSLARQNVFGTHLCCSI
jgi:hypothetical protein